MKIGHRDLNRQVLIVAEVGNNHEGSFTLAQELIGLAAQAGADAIKFQTIVPERLVSPRLPERIAQLERFRLSYDQFSDLARLAQKAGIIFLSTPFDLESARFLNHLVPAFKIASGDNNFQPLLAEVAATGKPVLLSTGLTDLEDVRRSAAFIRGLWREKGLDGELALLHCVSSYPTSPEESNLLAIKGLATLGFTVGYSDHTLGLSAAVLSVALGARIIEKHFTIDKHHSSFRDHQLSADPVELAELVQRVREAETLLGRPEKRLMATERSIVTSARRSIVAGRDLAAGTRLTFEHFDWLRPGDGLPPGQEEQLLRRPLLKDKARGETILAEEVGPTLEV